MESVKLATGPLLIEIERPCNEDLGLFLSNQRVPEDVYSSGSDTYQRVGTCNAIYIDSILPASISDRFVNILYNRFNKILKNYQNKSLFKVKATFYNNFYEQLTLFLINSVFNN